MTGRANQYHPPIKRGNVTMYGGRGKGSTEYAVAMHPTVQAKLQSVATKKASKARALLDASAKRRTGTSQIKVQGPPTTDVDWHVALDDSRGESWGAAIEFGRKATAHRAGTRGLFVLTRAFGLRGRR